MSALRCNHCGATFEGELDARCPKCLRKTSVVAVDGVEATGAAASGGARAAAWPAGTSCPLCLERDVSEASEAIFWLEIARRLQNGMRSSTVRCRCCSPCRERIVGLAKQRRVAAPFVAIGMMTCVLALFPDGPFVRMGIPHPTSIAVGLFVGFVAAGIPLYLVDRANRTLRSAFEATWLFRRVRESFTDKDGFLAEEQWKILADVSDGIRNEAVSAETIVETKKA